MQTMTEKLSTNLHGVLYPNLYNFNHVFLDSGGLLVINISMIIRTNISCIK